MTKHLITLGIAVLLITVGLSGCTEIEYSNEKSTDDDFWDIEIIGISSSGVVQTINYLEKSVKLMVSGSNCDITVTKETDLVDVRISGIGTIVRVSKSHSFTFGISGPGSEIVYYD